jgi:hypothetical protein
MVLTKDKRVFVRPGFTDIRKQINGLCALIQELRPKSPFGIDKCRYILQTLGVGRKH